MGSAVALTAIMTSAGIGAAWAFSASFSYTLSDNGIIQYDSRANQLKLIDVKNGDNIYAQYSFTNTECGSAGDACRPSGSSSFRLISASKDATQTITVDPGGKQYLVVRLCNDDAPPDTCSKWKRTGA